MINTDKKIKTLVKFFKSSQTENDSNLFEYNMIEHNIIVIATLCVL